MASGKCSNCGESAVELLKGECRTCYTWRYRHGEARPETAIVAHARRFNERQATREMLSRYAYTYDYTYDY